MTSPTTIGDLAQMVDFGETGLAVLAVAGVLVVLYVTWRGAQFVLDSIQARNIMLEEDRDQMERERARWAGE